MTTRPTVGWCHSAFEFIWDVHLGVVDVAGFVGLPDDLFKKKEDI